MEQNQTQTETAAAVRSKDLLGLGWRYVPDEKSLYLLFEIADGATDENNQPCPCGAKIKISGIKGDMTDKAQEKCEELAKIFMAEGIKEAGIDPGKLTPITWEKYQAEGYDEK